MTVFGWDASHYDGALTKDILVKAKAEGIDFFTHKVGEGVSVGDGTQGTALAAARDAGIEVLGAYWFIHSNDDILDEVQALVKQLDANESWWRTHPYFFIQCDAEKSATGLPSADYVRRWCNAATAVTGKIIVCYASQGMYGDTLTGLGHPLWNANYGSNPRGPFASVYPGDNSRGWSAYSGQTPAILQFGSNTIIAGLTTCDANAFRGTLDRLKALIGGTVMADAPTADEIADAILANVIDQPGVKSTVGNLLAVTQLAAASAKAQAAANGNMLSAIQSTLAWIKSAVDKIPTTAGTATLSDADKAAIVKGVLDGLEGRLAS